MVSRRVVRAYQALYGMGADKATMYDLTNAIDVHAHARGGDEEDPLHAAQEASRAGMKAILYKSISPRQAWEVARRLQDDWGWTPRTWWPRFARSGPSTSCCRATPASPSCRRPWRPTVCWRRRFGPMGGPVLTS